MFNKDKFIQYRSLFPHDHQMSAVIGIYSGREDNIFWSRIYTSIEVASRNLTLILVF